MKIHEALSLATRQLQAAGLASAVGDAQWLLAFKLGKERSHLFARLQDILDDDAVAGFQELIALRAKGKPLQYILGTQEFCGMQFEVTPEVLIPRPETEILVEEAKRLLRFPESTIVDVGTGSGCVAVALAVALPGCRIFATDISMAALEVARRNADRFKVSNNIEFFHSDLAEVLIAAGMDCQIDCILSNPPYVAENEWDTLQSEVKDWEPRLALYGGVSGTDVYRRLIPEAARLLKSGGYLLLEIGFNALNSVTALFDSGWAVQDVRNDMNGIPRVVIAGRK